jgi:adenosylmethionine-8-amino-7-oxononanoate aminotransferase
MDLFHGIFSPLRFETVRVPSPYCYRCPEKLDRSRCSLECARRAEEIMARHAGRLAALVIEPAVQGAAGMIVHPEGYLGRMKQACEKHSVLLIADEVATGFGRTGALFACSGENVTPDLLCLAKGMTGGYLPLAATLATEEIFSAFLGTPESGKAFLHGHTYTGNALACAAAVESLKLLRRSVMPSLPEKMHLLSDLLDEKVRPLRHVGDVRLKGLMAGIELVADTATGEPYPAVERTGHRVILAARARGVLLRPLGDVIVLMPPLTITAGEIGRLVEAAADSIIEVTEQGEHQP